MRKGVSYAKVRRKIQTADILLFRGRGCTSRVLSVAGRSPYTHAAICVWHHNVLLCAEFREFRGGRSVNLSSQVRRFPGRIDVFRAPSLAKLPAIREAIGDTMLRWTGQQYNWRGILAASFLHLPLIRVFATPDLRRENGSGDDRPRYCSQAVSDVYQLESGLDLVPQLPGRLSEPADLARSAALAIVFEGLTPP